MTEDIYCDRCRRPTSPPQVFDTHEALMASLAEPAWKNIVRPDRSLGVICPGCVTALEQEQLDAQADEGS